MPENKLIPPLAYEDGGSAFWQSRSCSKNGDVTLVCEKGSQLSYMLTRKKLKLGLKSMNSRLDISSPGEIRTLVGGSKARYA